MISRADREADLARRRARPVPTPEQVEAELVGDALVRMAVAIVQRSPGPQCGLPLDCGAECFLAPGHGGGCSCPADEDGPGTCPA